MMNALYIGATGMHAQQQNVESIANNLANVNTAGFKKNRVVFSDAVYRMANASPVQAEGNTEPVSIGLGTLVSSNAKSFALGDPCSRVGAPDEATRGSIGVTVDAVATRAVAEGNRSVGSEGEDLTMPIEIDLSRRLALRLASS